MHRLGVYSQKQLLLSHQPPMGRSWFVDATNGNDGSSGSLSTHPFATLAQAVSSASAGDIIYHRGFTDEAATISKALTVIGVGGRGYSGVAPTTTNATAITVTADDVTLINMGCDGDGTGPGLHLSGDVDRFRAYGCKIEGDDYGARLESTAAGAVSDSLFQDCEFEWASTAFHFKVSGAGDPVTQTVIKDSRFGNFATVAIHAETTHTADVRVLGNYFFDQEDGSQPTDFLLLDVASTTGLVSGNHFATPTNDTAVLTIAAGVHWGPNGTEAGWSSARPA